MKTEVHSVADLIASDRSPLPLDVIPNHMGINLCSVEAIGWTRQMDGQLVSLTIHFIPFNPRTPNPKVQRQRRRGARKRG